LNEDHPPKCFLEAAQSWPIQVVLSFPRSADAALHETEISALQTNALTDDFKRDPRMMRRFVDG
jgi:hypothetical protein